ncbi:hypothetical protein AMC83_PA00028 (plasmid) [Rhizobium phaseoli]|uniref:hypothetical protein n=1 Tax=Rhizobium phaseoli TaxID=396 RepID=UPI0007E9F714|nr:hypothetical protein [Rhizobium phaseoli]ANL74255.1 hypothetical protein AMC83_PA00028 [Rhizobium phaseoli]
MSNSSANYVQVPETAKINKPIFDTCPGDEVTEEVKAFIEAGNDPWHWRGHSHTPPPKYGTPPNYVGRFYLQKAQVESKNWAPCPCCSPDHRKFGRDGGLIAYFPDERVIRLIGPDCFGSLNHEGHENAIADLKRREREKSELEYILRCVGKIDQWRSAIDEMMKIAKQADSFFPGIQNRIEVSLQVKLWRNIRDGMLRVTEKLKTVKVGADGQQEEVTERIDTVLFQLDGYKALNPERKALAPILDKLAADLRKIGHVSESSVELMPPVDRTALSKELKRILTSTQSVHDALAHELRFLSQVNVNRFRQWAADERSPVDFEFERKEGTISIRGHKVFNGMPIPEELRTSYLPSIDAPVMNAKRQ